MATNPITWRSINGPNPAEALRPLQAATQTFNNSFDILNRVIQERQAANQGVIDRADEAAVLGFREALANARTPEQLAAAQSQFDAYREQMSTKARGGVLGLEETRGNQLRQNLLADREFGDKDALYRHRATIQAAEAEYARGNQAAGDALLAPIRGELPNYGELAGKGVTGSRAATRFDNDQQEHKWKGDRNTRENAAEDRARDADRLRNQLTEFQISNEKRKQEEQETTDYINQTLNRAASNRQTIAGAMNQAVSKAARELPGLNAPFHSDGTLNVGALNTEQKTLLGHELAIKGLPTLDSLQSGDTAAFKNVMNEIRQSGRNITPAQIQAANQVGAAMFDTTAAARLGNDAQTAATTEGMESAREEQLSRIYGTVGTKENRQALINKLPSLLKNYAKEGTDRYRNYARKLTNFLNEDGIKIPIGNGESQTIIPSEEVLIGIIANMSRSGDWAQWHPGATGGLEDIGSNDLDSPINAWKNNPENKKYGAEIVKLNTTKLAKKALKSANK